MSKPLSIKYPQTQQEAWDIMITLAREFNSEVIILSQDDMSDFMGTEDWTEKDYKKAIQLAVEELCEGVGYAMDNAYHNVNNSKKKFKN
jgi:hypothetical protein